MRNIIFLFILLIPFALISGRKQPVQNEKTEKYVKTARLVDFKDDIKLDKHESKGDPENTKPGNAPEGLPQILFIIHTDKGMTTWTPSLWWSYKHNEPGQKGC